MFFNVSLDKFDQSISFLQDCFINFCGTLIILACNRVAEVKVII
jgi:hypothetical protein